MAPEEVKEPRTSGTSSLKPYQTAHDYGVFTHAIHIAFGPCVFPLFSHGPEFDRPCHNRLSKEKKGPMETKREADKSSTRRLAIGITLVQRIVNNLTYCFVMENVFVAPPAANGRLKTVSWFAERLTVASVPVPSLNA